ncbi:hypothetical protein V8E55_007007 [Tylopilus felleus]
MPDGQVGITLDTIMFTLFLPDRVNGDAHGARDVVAEVDPDSLLKMANWSSNLVIVYAIVAVITWGTMFPCIRNAPLKAPP